LETEKREIDLQSRALNARLCKVDKQLRTVNNQIAKMENKGTIVTEHAVLRYLERGLGMDMKQVRDHILTGDVRTLAESGASGQVPIDHGCKAVIKNRTVVSITGGEHGQ
jgi:hypothetical protein